MQPTSPLKKCQSEPIVLLSQFCCCWVVLVFGGVSWVQITWGFYFFSSLWLHWLSGSGCFFVSVQAVDDGNFVPLILPKPQYRLLSQTESSKGGCWFVKLEEYQEMWMKLFPEIIQSLLYLPKKITCFACKIRASIHDWKVKLDDCFYPIPCLCQVEEQLV